MKNKTNTIRKSRCYRWFENMFYHIETFLFILFFGLIFGCYFWFQETLDIYGYYQTTFDNHGINIWILGLVFFIIWEAFYIWMCKNDNQIKRSNIILAKFLSFFPTFFIFTIIIPACYYILKNLKGIDWIYVFKALGIFILYIVAIGIIGWLFYKLNVLIFEYIRG